jgi:hypothetical protein
MDPILTLMRCMSRLPPERKAQIQTMYASARAAGGGDKRASIVALQLLTDAERAEPDVHEPTVGRRPALARAGSYGPLPETQVPQRRATG